MKKTEKTTKGDVRTTGVMRYRVVQINRDGTIMAVTSSGSHGRYSEKRVAVTASSWKKMQPLTTKRSKS